MFPRFALVLFAAIVLAPTSRAQTAVEPRTDSLGDPLPSGAVARLGTLRFKHNIEPNLSGRIISPGGVITSNVIAAVFSPDGKKIASLGQPFGSIRCWDAASGKELPGPWSKNSTNAVALAVSPDGAIVASGGFSRQGNSPAIKIDLWDVAAGKQLKTLTTAVPDFDDNIRALVFAEDGKTVLSVGHDAVRWWNLESGKVERSWKPPLPTPAKSRDANIETETDYDYWFSPDAKSLAVHVTASQFDPNSAKPPLTIMREADGFDLATGKQRWRTVDNGNPQIAFSGDGKRVAIDIGSNHIEIRNAVNGKLIDTLTLDIKAFPVQTINTLALSPDGSTLAIGGPNGNAALWNLVARPSGPAAAEPTGQEPAGQFRAFVIRIAQAQFDSVRTMTFSPDGKMLLMAAEADLRIYDVATLKEVNPWDGHRSWVDHVAFSADGQHLLTGSAQFNFSPKELATWEVGNWKRLRLTSNREPLRPNIGLVSPEHALYLGNNGDDRFRVFEMATGKALGRFSVPPLQAPGAAKFFSPSSKLFMLAGKDEQNKDCARLYRLPSCKLLCLLPALPAYSTNDSSRPVAFSSDDRLVAMFGRDDTVIQIFETANGKLHKRLGRPPEVNVQLRGRVTSSLAFSPDGKLLASWSMREPFVRIWDVTTGRARLLLQPDQFRFDHMHFAWSPDSRMLALGDHKIQLLEVMSGKIRREFTGHEGDIRSLAFSPDGKLLASGSVDTTVLIWDVGGR